MAKACVNLCHHCLQHLANSTRSAAGDGTARWGTRFRTNEAAEQIQHVKFNKLKLYCYVKTACK